MFPARRFAVPVAACILSCSAAVSQKAAGQAPATTATGVIVACYSDSSGAVRIVSISSQCKSTERSISWDVRGPIGPAGPKGATGPRGPEGPEAQRAPQELQG